MVSMDHHESDESSGLLAHRHPMHPHVEGGAIGTEPLLNSSSAETELPHSNHFKKLWINYVVIVERHPLVTKSITATIILGGADLVAQGLEHARGVSSTVGIDWPRAARFACFGLFGAPWSHYYFHVLDHYIPPSTRPCSNTTLLKVVIDQFIQAPILLAIMISMLSLMKGEGMEGVKQDLSDSFWNALIANCMSSCVSLPMRVSVPVCLLAFCLTFIIIVSFLLIGKLWLPASAINMLFVKPSLRVLYVNVIFFVWTIILSLMLNGSNTGSST